VPAIKVPRSHPSLHWGAEKNGKKKAETGGLGQGQFNRTANKGNRNNNDTEKGNTQNKTYHRESRSHRLPPRAPETQVSSRRPAPPHRNPA